jgi:hypothetical protein
MMDKERWKIQNRVYRMKDRKLKLENFIKQTEKDIQFIKNFNLFERDEDIKFRHYILAVVLIFILHLDKIFDFYYMKYKAFKMIKSAKKEILTLTKKINIYEQYKFRSRSN